MMKIKHWLLACFALSLASCGRRDQMKALYAEADNALLQRKTMNGLNMQLQYLPEGPNGGAPGELCFKLNVTAVDASNKINADFNQASYGVDTLFQLIMPGDTILPIHAMRIANGMYTGAEYLIVFDKARFATTTTGRFVFRDWLFSNSRVEFNVKPAAVRAADSLSTRI
ncbi:hypothetical protein MKQ68_10840 [Chitinophaga horti]|uniref:Lipoprotein n=1 Tax=Chitinophaga horti TaxID=2920382 RepID=A0ABY6JB39_9BACT|nr:hypothetical protein [Chitinophaga horti]UYQ95597.1 hypothetical protein MKQ68_10840 [Chitinophaga horti]